MKTPSDRSIILFDGVCNLCNGFVNFVIDRDPDGVFRFAALQSEAGRQLVRDHGAVSSTGGEVALLQSVILIEDGTLYRRSTAALRIARHLTPPWPLLYAFIVVPKAIRNAVYDQIAARRHDWFGQRDQCRVPTPALKDRFLDGAASV
jgi:predicted DCC family thiol-disulfide oxidoreductase YuxK